MTLPSFLIIGAQKAGTSWFADKLRQHPDVYMPARELHYFDKDSNFRRGLSWYESHFAEAKGQRALGEKTPDYLWANGNGVEGHLSDVHWNVHRVLPEAKLIAILRNPVDRAISATNHLIRSGRVSPLHSIDDILVGKKRYLVEGHGVIDKGRYYRQIKAYLECFKRRQLLVLVFEEDVVRDPAAGLIKVCRFLEIDPSFPFRQLAEKHNAPRRSKLRLVIDHYLPILRPHSSRIDRYLPAWKGRPSVSVLRKMRALYAAENEELFDLLSCRISAWNPAMPRRGE